MIEFLQTFAWLTIVGVLLSLAGVANEYTRDKKRVKKLGISPEKPRCPYCDYIAIGWTTPRCPECSTDCHDPGVQVGVRTRKAWIEGCAFGFGAPYITWVFIELTGSVLPDGGSHRIAAVLYGVTVFVCVAIVSFVSRVLGGLSTQGYATPRRNDSPSTRGHVERAGV